MCLSNFKMQLFFITNKIKNILKANQKENKEKQNLKHFVLPNGQHKHQCKGQNRRILKHICDDNIELTEVVNVGAKSLYCVNYGKQTLLLIKQTRTLKKCLLEIIRLDFSLGNSKGKIINI